MPEKCELFENNWSNANLSGASLMGSDLSRGTFSRDCWQQVNLRGCDLTFADLDGLDPRRVNLEGVKICAATGATAGTLGSNSAAGLARMQTQEANIT